VEPVRAVFAVLGILAGLASTAAAAGPGGYATLKDERPEPLAWTVPRVVFDCTPLDTVTIAVGSVDTLAGDTTGGESLVDGYACEPLWPEIGPEHAYRLEIAERLELRAVLDASVPGLQDLDVILLRECDTETCEAQANNGFAVVVEPGSYILMVDGYLKDPGIGWEGPYRVELTGRVPGVPPVICTPEGSELLEVETTAPLDTTATLFAQPDRLDTYDGCVGAALVPGGERWYTVRIAGPGAGWQSEVAGTVSTFAPGLDLAVWLFADCGEDATCLGFVDDGIGGEAETFTIAHEGTEPLTVYLGVDCFLAPADSATGAFSLEFATTVATEARSWGDVRSLFR